LEPAIWTLGKIGYAPLIARYDLAVPLPGRLAAIAQRHHPTATALWLMQTRALHRE
jgi:hypothetical protein